jgi:hypothetical protein
MNNNIFSPPDTSIDSRSNEFKIICPSCSRSFKYNPSKGYLFQLRRHLAGKYCMNLIHFRCTFKLNNGKMCEFTTNWWKSDKDNIRHTHNELNTLLQVCTKEVAELQISKFIKLAQEQHELNLVALRTEKNQLSQISNKEVLNNNNNIEIKENNSNNNNYRISTLNQDKRNKIDQINYQTEIITRNSPTAMMILELLKTLSLQLKQAQFVMQAIQTKIFPDNNNINQSDIAEEDELNLQRKTKSNVEQLTRKRRKLHCKDEEDLELIV